MSALELKIPPTVQTALAALLMWLISSQTPNAPLGQAIRIALCSAIVLISGGIVVLGIWDFRKARTTTNPFRPEKASALVVSGIYRRTRNPMYLGFLLLLLGWAVFLANAWSLLVVPAYVAYMSRFQIAPEERAMAAGFGSDYENYCQRVRRWI